MLGDRSSFPDLEAAVYFNHAAIAPPSLRVRSAIASAVDEYARRGADAWPVYGEQRHRLRAKLARLIGANPSDIGLVPSTSQGIVDIALCLPWQRGDRVVVFEGEFPANVTPWQRAARLHGGSVTMRHVADFVRSHAHGLEALERELERGGVRFVAVSAVQFQNGLRMPIDELVTLCHRFQAQVFVDAIQAVGAVPIDVGASEVDYLVAGSHKWLMGVEGCAMLYVAPQRVAGLQPWIASWLSHADATRFLFEGSGHLRYDRELRARADVFEIGAMNVLGCVALEAAVDDLLTIGVDAIHAHVQSIHDRLEPQLVALGCTNHRATDAAGRSGILSVTPPAHVDVVAMFGGLRERGIACAIPDGHLRFSPHWPNDTAQADLVAAAVADYLRDVT